MSRELITPKTETGLQFLNNIESSLLYDEWNDINNFKLLPAKYLPLSMC